VGILINPVVPASDIPPNEAEAMHSIVKIKKAWDKRKSCRLIFVFYCIGISKLM
jgi:hypothetical protein